MIPQRLQLKNFLSYANKEEIIDFSPYPLICLSGKNGHGKSAILDAITWALWGQARKISGTSKPDAQLLHLGQTFMTVSFDFIFNNQTYRVRREYARTHGKPHAALDFGIINRQNDNVTSLTDKTIRKTQEKIVETIGLDFDAFINTAFLRQGQANEFSKKSPKERKDLLASILSLDNFDAIRKRASEKQKELQITCATITQWNERIEKELEQKTVLQEQLKNIELEQKTCIHLEEQLVTQQEDLSKQLQRKVRFQTQLEKEQATYQERLAHKAEFQEKIRTLFATWRARHRALRKLPQPQTLLEKKQACSQTIVTHQKKLQATLEYKEQLLTIKTHQHTLQQKLENEVHKQEQILVTTVEQTKLQLQTNQEQRKHISERITAYLDDCKQLTQEADILRKQDEKLAVQLKQDSSLQQQFDKRKLAYHTWAAELKMIEQEQQELVSKTAFVTPEHNPSCPLCEQNLSAARKRFLKTKFSKRKQFLVHRRARLIRVLTQLKPILIKQHAQLEHVRALTSKREQLAAQQESGVKQLEKTKTLLLAQQKQEAEQEKTHKLLEKKQLEQQAAVDTYTKSISTEIAHHPEHKALTQKLSELEQKIKSTVYDQQAHSRAQKELEQLQQQETLLAQAQEIQEQQIERKNGIHELVAKLKKLKSDENALQELTKKHAAVQNACTKLEKQVAALHEKLKELARQKELLAGQLGKLQQQQTKLTQLERELSEQVKKIGTLKQEADDYSTIATAMGKDGIQALLIEDALPEIEHEANELLGELTDNQAHIIIESLRDLKKGGTKETLDIKISDPAGIRPYEMFSGGEAFRIDFALRIAISKLLARRAGTSLQTLIIDEGFGSQDEEGLAHITQALHKIQDHFKKIIIVSHLPAMKDQFPVHFYVEKQGSGSHVHVIEQG